MMYQVNYMKPNYGVIRSKQMTQISKQQIQNLQHQTRGTGIHYQHVYKNQKDMMIKNNICLSCEGKGRQFIFFSCSSCKGSGYVNYCQSCNGTGRAWIFKCRYCLGIGVIEPPIASSPGNR